MIIISLDKFENGARSVEEQNHRREVWMDGWIEVPEQLRDKAYASNGFCELVFENGILKDIVPDEDKLEHIRRENLEREVREKRNILLNDADTVYCNAERWETMDESAKEFWRGYKQALRDVTLQEGFPYYVLWPEIL